MREGDTINIDITGPGATLALGMMFFDSGNEAIAEWMDAPRTQFLLEFVRPGLKHKPGIILQHQNFKQLQTFSIYFASYTT